jgi:hypothetical protein
MHNHCAFKKLAVLAGSAALFGCAAGASNSVFSPPSLPAGAASVSFRIAVPRAVPRGARVRPSYVSVQTQSLAVTIDGGATPVVLNLYPGGNGCDNNASTLTCTVNVPVAPGSHTYLLRTYDQPNAGGNVLSVATVPATASPAGQTTTIPVTLSGVPASLAVVLASPKPPQTAAATSAVNVTAFDADGRAIGSPGNYATAGGAPLTITLANSDGSGISSLASSSVTAPGQSITLSYTGAALASATITASAAGVPNATATFAPRPYERVFTAQAPVVVNQNDGTAYELGMKFQSTVPGVITAIRYWRDSLEGTPHTGNLWTSGGGLIGQVAFAGETASGWQQQALAAPVAIAAGTTYIVSVNVNTDYVYTTNGLLASITNGDLSSVADGADGVYVTTAGSFPTSTFNNTNYFRDVVFLRDP